MTRTLSVRAEPGERTILMTRFFEAPRELVWRAYTDPAAIPHWWGPARYATTVEQMEVRPGGRWRYISRDAEGNEYAFNGEYREVVPPERLVATFQFEGAPGDAPHSSLDSATFEERGGGTLLTIVSHFDSVEARDAMLSTDMEEGAAEGFDRLAAYVATLAAEGIRS
jgi:uncharacterized protein YndB with AHSA1/START domain